MEVTLLIKATDDAFRMMEEAREQATGILDAVVDFTAEMRNIHNKRVHTIFRSAQESRHRIQNFIVTSLLLFAFWVVLSGRFDVFHLSIGVFCSLLVARLSHDLLFANIRIGDHWLVLVRFLAYAPWHIYQIFKANVYVAYLTLSPKPSIDPGIVKFKTKLETDISWVILANSITLTPGTITMDIRDGEFYVHALDKRMAQDLNTGEMEDRVAHIFMEADHMYVQDALDVARIYSEIQ